MALISYNIGCRNCLQGDGMRHMYSLMDDEIDELQSKTEFEVMALIENWREQDNHTCDFCDSGNVEILEIEVNDERLYDYEKIVERCQEEGEYMLQINIDKMGADINLTPGGSQRFDQNFLKQAFFDIYETIINRPDSQFKLQYNGNMFICVTGGTNFIDNQPHTRIETFRSAGLLKEQILNAIQEFIDEIGVSIDFKSTFNSPINFDLNFVFKSSDHLRFENGKLISGPHGGAGRAVKVEPNISGDEGCTVTLYNLDGNHPVWQNNVQMAPKQMKVIQQTNEKIVLRGYGYDAMGSSFADYGLTITLDNGTIENGVVA
ncbi:MAG: hypothetical protein ACKV1O_06100 [Saprospiraceae bacterium]